MNLVLGMYQQAFKEGCIAHTNVALREMNRYCKCRGRSFRYLSTVSCGFPLPDNIFYPDYSNVYVYVLCHTVNKRGDEELEMNGKENKIYDDEEVESIKNTDFNYGIVRFEGPLNTAYNIQVTYKVSVRN